MPNSHVNSKMYDTLEKCYIEDYDTITGPYPVAWLKVQALVEHCIKLEARITKLEENKDV